MPRHQVSVEAVINAPAKLAYAIIADSATGTPTSCPSRRSSLWRWNGAGTARGR